MTQLPPPDPHERALDTLPEPLQAPIAIFPLGAPPADADAVADRVLDLRPGLFVVVARD